MRERPRYIDKETKEVIDEDYVLMKIKYEKEMANPRYQEPKPQEQSHLPEANSHVISSYIGKVTLKLHVDSSMVMVEQIFLTDVDDRKSNDLKKRYVEIYK